ncbi:MAG: integrase arm-type DNA-binding domain-containing protein [Novosphingobium sp.]|nr:integrase arm-type DNA-binding domain-containing protein [Novosphingobium sp.]
MPKIALTKQNIDKVAKPGTGTVIYVDTRTKGFGLRVTASGAASFIMQGTVKGQKKERRVTIGSYGAWTVDQARRRAEEIGHQLEDGIDPVEERKQAEASKVTLRQVADAYMNRPTKMRESTKGEMNRHIDKVFAAWKDKPIADITESDVRARHREMCEAGLRGTPAPGQAQIALVTLRTLINFANKRYKRGDGTPLIKDNPVPSVMEDVEDFEPRTRHIEVTKVGEAWEMLTTLRDTARDADARAGVDLVRFLILTGARRGEAAKLKWDRVHLDDNPANCWWHIPDPKNKNPVWLPLSSQAVALLKARKPADDKDASPYVFPSRSKAGHVMDTRAPLEKISKIEGVIGVVAEEDARADRLSAHDMRRTFVTVGFAGCGIDLFKLELLTNHIPSGVTAKHYLQKSRLQYLHPEVQQLGNWIEREAMLARAKATGGNVVALPQRA